MTESTRPTSVTARFAVEIEREPESLLARVSSLSRMRPSGHVVVLSPCGFSFRREPDVFSAISSGASLGMAILLTEMTLRLPYFTVVGRVLIGCFLVSAVLLFTRFLVNSASAWEVVSDRGKVVSRRTVAGRTRASLEVDASSVVNVLVLGEEAQRRARVVLGGPRHELVAELYEVRALDPDRLAPFLAEMVSLVARHASAI